MRLFVVLCLVCFAIIQKAQGIIPDCESYLVKDLADEKLTASSWYCQRPKACNDANAHAAHFARLGATGISGYASWVALDSDTNQFIQADFETPKTITGVVLKSRPNVAQYVKTYKLKYSTDCNDFATVQENGQDKIFDGNTGADVAVTQYLENRVTARCVKINPQSWEGAIALQFDIIGF